VKQKTTHRDQLLALRRIEGQVQGIQRMVDEGKYCIDIVIQLHAVVNALYRVSEKVFARHISECVSEAFAAPGKAGKDRKIAEIIRVIHMLHKLE
jgi:CsoR family transcriptional regulator, copper-sensing transcriptional repressor